MTRLFAIAFSLTLTIFSSGVWALPASLEGGLSWRFVGPYRAGRTLAVSGVAGNPAVWYLGSVDGGVFKSTDAGTTWHPLFQHEPVASIGAVAVAPSNPQIVYVGTGESAIRSDISYGDGVWRSDDGGETWKHLGLDDTRHIGALLVDPHNADVVLVAALGHAFGPNEERGVFLTTDGGRNWRKVLFVNDKTGAIDLARDPSRPESVYAITWRARRPPWFQYPPLQGVGSAIWHSADGGRTWRRLPMRGLPKHGLGRIGVAVAPDTQGPRLYAVVDVAHQTGGANSSAHGSGVYRSDDGGVNWRLVDSDERLPGRGWYFGHIYVDPKDPNVVYIPNTALYRSDDGGAHFTAIKGSPDGDDYHSLWIDPENPKDMIVGVDQGAAVSIDGGQHWTPWYNQPTAQIYHLSTDDKIPYTIYATQQDSGALAIPSRSYEGIITNHSWDTVGGGGESGYIFPRTGAAKILYGSGYGGEIDRFDVKSRQITGISPMAIMPFGVPPDKVRYYFPWNTALAVSPFSPDTLYAGAQVVLRSTDQGNHWQVISPVLTARKAGAKCQGKPTLADAAACGYSVIRALAASPVDKGELWAGTDDGRIWLSRDDGAHWQNVTPSGLKSWSQFDTIEPSPNDAATAYAAVDRHRVDDLAPYIYVTHDFGRHWRDLVHGIPFGDYVHVVRADPVRHGLLFAGTEQGIFVSFDDGAHWQALQFNLPTTSVRDLKIHGADLVAATHGRGIWVLDDMEPLREASEKSARSPVRLYQPEPAVRLRASLYFGEGMPPEIPHASNPPAGAIIDYSLAEQPTAPVSVAIYAADGTLVRRYASDTKPDKMPPPRFHSIWAAPPEVLPAHAGLNRFVWNLRYTPPRTPTPDWGSPALLHGTPRGAQSPLVPPGSYRVVLTVAGRNYEAPLSVRPNPNVSVPPDALEARVKLGLAVRDAIDRSTHWIQRARRILQAAKKRGEHARTRTIKKALDASDLVEVNEHLVELLKAIDQADSDPPEPMTNAVSELQSKVQKGSHLLAKLLGAGAR